MEKVTSSLKPIAVMKSEQPFHHGLLLLLMSIAHLPLDYFGVTFTTFVTVLTFSKHFSSLTFAWDACVTTFSISMKS